jgi:hypothetical protein
MRAFRGALRDRGLLLSFLLLGAGLLLAGAPAGASPLGLQAGDLIDTIEWDALQPGQGGSFDQTIQQLFTNGRITNVDVERAPAFPPTLTHVPQSNVTFTFAVDLVAVSLSGTFLNATFSGASAVTPDVTVIQNGNVILTGDFVGNFVFGGDISSPTLLSAGNIAITGGDPSLVAAIGSIAVLTLRASVFDFSPNILAIGASISGNQINTNFTASFSGTLKPANSSPFVPEPGTALMLGTGTLVVLGLLRRRTHRVRD